MKMFMSPNGRGGAYIDGADATIRHWGSSEVDAEAWEGGEGAIILQNIGAGRPGSGKGTDLLRGLTQWADDQGLRLILKPVPGTHGWYARHGFKQVGDYWERKAG